MALNSLSKTSADDFYAPISSVSPEIYNIAVVSGKTRIAGNRFGAMGVVKVNGTTVPAGDISGWGGTFITIGIAINDGDSVSVIDGNSNESNAYIYSATSGGGSGADTSLSNLTNSGAIKTGKYQILRQGAGILAIADVFPTSSDTPSALYFIECDSSRNVLRNEVFVTMGAKGSGAVFSNVTVGAMYLVTSTNYAVGSAVGDLTDAYAWHIENVAPNINEIISFNGYVRIVGSGFGDNQGEVFINGTAIAAGDIKGWSGGWITIEDAAAPSPGSDIYIVTADGVTSNMLTYTTFAKINGHEIMCNDQTGTEVGVLNLQSPVAQTVDSNIVLDMGNEILGLDEGGTTHVLMAHMTYVTAASFSGSRTGYGVPFNASDILSNQSLVDYVPQTKVIKTKDSQWMWWDTMLPASWQVFTPLTVVEQDEYSSGAQHFNGNSKDRPTFDVTGWGHKFQVAELADISGSRPEINEAFLHNPAGTPMFVIQGINFGATAGTVTLDGTAVSASDIYNWSDSAIGITGASIPSNYSTVLVTDAAGNVSNSYNWLNQFASSDLSNLSNTGTQKIAPYMVYSTGNVIIALCVVPFGITSGQMWLYEVVNNVIARKVNMNGSTGAAAILSGAIKGASYFIGLGNLNVGDPGNMSTGKAQALCTYGQPAGVLNATAAATISVSDVQQDGLFVRVAATMELQSTVSSNTIIATIATNNVQQPNNSNVITPVFSVDTPNIVGYVRLSPQSGSTCNVVLQPFASIPSGTDIAFDLTYSV